MEIICKKVVYFQEDWDVSANTVCVWVLSSGGAVEQSLCVSWDSSAGLWACVWLRVMWLWPPVCVLGGTAGLGIWLCIHICTALSVSFFPKSLKYLGTLPHNSKELFSPLHSEMFTALLLHSLEVELSLPLPPGMFSCLYKSPDKFLAPMGVHKFSLISCIVPISSGGI